jgi:hypothetical protein
MGETNLQKHVLELDPGDDASGNALLSKIYRYFMFASEILHCR